MAAEENNFDELRKLLVLKRHEQPPPGYFEDLPDNIMRRIHAGDTAADLPWLVRLFQYRFVRSAFVGSLGTALAALMVYGVISSQQTTAPTRPGLDPGVALLSGEPLNTGAQPPRPTFFNSFANGNGEPSSVRPATATTTNDPPSLFAPLQFQPLHVERTGYFTN